MYIYIFIEKMRRQKKERETRRGSRPRQREGRRDNEEQMLRRTCFGTKPPWRQAARRGRKRARAGHQERQGGTKRRARGGREGKKKPDRSDKLSPQREQNPKQDGRKHQTETSPLKMPELTPQNPREPRHKKKLR